MNADEHCDTLRLQIIEQFLAMFPEFPADSEAAISAVTAKVRECGWPLSVQSLIAAHTLCLREHLYTCHWIN